MPGNTQRAFLIIYNLTGKQLKSIELLASGDGEVTVSGGEFGPGMYMYALIVDGKVIDTKRMVLTD